MTLSSDVMKNLLFPVSVVTDDFLSIYDVCAWSFQSILIAYFCRESTANACEACFVCRYVSFIFLFSYPVMRIWDTFLSENGTMWKLPNRPHKNRDCMKELEVWSRLVMLWFFIYLFTTTDCLGEQPDPLLWYCCPNSVVGYEESFARLDWVYTEFRPSFICLYWSPTAETTGRRGFRWCVLLCWYLSALPISLSYFFVQ